MPKNICLKYSNKGFLPTKCCSIRLDTLDDLMNVLKVLPDKVTNARVLGDSLVETIREDVASVRSLDGDIISEGLGQVRDFRSKNVGDIALEYGVRIMLLYPSISSISSYLLQDLLS